MNISLKSDIIQIKAFQKATKPNNAKIRSPDTPKNNLYILLEWKEDET